MDREAPHAGEDGRARNNTLVWKAAIAGAPMQEVVRVRVDYEFGRITREEAVRRLRELAGKAGNGRRAR